MIDLDKHDQEPTEEEIQNYVQSLYDYAADLYIEQNKSWSEVQQDLVNQGLDYDLASTIVENLKEQERSEKHEAGNKELGYGFLFTVGGIALTALTDGTVLFYGAVFVGVWLIIKGLWHKIQ